jgi:hypothetical protein
MPATLPINLRHIIAGLLGAAAALLLARLVLRLLAARPDNPIFGLLFALTSPPSWLLFLDRGQPRFGATLEFSTLALSVCCAAVALLIARWGARAGRSRP